MKFRTPKPIFRQIADHIIVMIITNQWEIESRIPSVRDLASEIEVNPNTVARTYALLSDEGIINAQRGLGYFLDKNAVSLSKKLLKKQFINDDLPHIKSMLEILDIEPTELKNM